MIVLKEFKGKEPLEFHFGERVLRVLFSVSLSLLASWRLSLWQYISAICYEQNWVIDPFDHHKSKPESVMQITSRSRKCGIRCI